MVEKTEGQRRLLRSARTHWRAILDTAATVSVIAACATLVWVQLFNRHAGQLPAAGRPTAPAGATRPAPPPAPKEPLSLRGAALKGDPGAKVAIIEYSDFQCPYCAGFARETLPTLTEKYVKSGKVVIAFRHLPLGQIHRFAVKAAEAAECAGRQGKFWEMHDVLFQKQKEIDEPNLGRFAGALGLDSTRFATCLDGQAAAHVKEDAASAGPLVVNGTPTFFVGSVQSDGSVRVAERLTGALPAKDFEAVLDKLLSAKAD